MRADTGLLCPIKPFTKNARLLLFLSFLISSLFFLSGKIYAWDSLPSHQAPNSLERIDVDVRQNFRANQPININQLASTYNSQLRGKEVVRVIVRARALNRVNPRNSDLALEINQRQVGYPQLLTQSLSNLRFDLTNPVILTAPVPRFILTATGPLYIEGFRIVVRDTFRPVPPSPPGPNYETVRESVDELIMRFNPLRVFETLGLIQNHRNNELMNVAVTVRDFSNRTIGARLVINGQSFGQFEPATRLSGFDQRVLLRIPPREMRRIGTDIRSLQVEFDKEFVYVTELEALVNVINRRPVPPTPPTPRPPRSFTQDLNFRNVGNLVKPLVSMTDMDFNLQHSDVESISIRSRGKGRTNLRVCRRDMFHNVTDCQAFINISNATQTYQLPLGSLRNAIKTNQVVFQMHGNIEISSITVNFSR